MFWFWLTALEWLKQNLHTIFFSKWLSHSFNRKILIKKRGERWGLIALCIVEETNPLIYETISVSWKNFYLFIFLLFFFFNNARKSWPPSWKFSSLTINSSIEGSYHVTPSPPQREKVPLKTSVHFLITITIC